MNELSEVEEEAVLVKMKQVVPGSFKEMFASHVLYIQAYPQIAHIVGICILQCYPPITLLFNKEKYSIFTDINCSVLDFLISQLTVIRKESISDVWGWERWVFERGNFNMFNITSVYNPKYRRLSKYKMNIWGVKIVNVDTLLGKKIKTEILQGSSH
jgi:hypothetical protein